MSEQMQTPLGTGSLNDPEPAPVKNDLPEIWPLIIKELVEREKHAGTVEGLVLNVVVADAYERHTQGLIKYGVGLQPFNGRDALKDAYQEALDMLAYTRQFAWEVSMSDADREAATELMDIAVTSAMAYRSVIFARDGK